MKKCRDASFLLAIIQQEYIKEGELYTLAISYPSADSCVGTFDPAIPTCYFFSCFYTCLVLLFLNEQTTLLQSLATSTYVPLEALMGVVTRLCNQSKQTHSNSATVRQAIVVQVPESSSMLQSICEPQSIRFF